MLHSEINKWEIFKIPPVQPVQYYSILKRKREFFQLIKQYDAQVDKHSCLHYCSIVPKSISFSLYDKHELLIVFLGDVPCTSFIGLRVNVTSETFMHESNSLLLFLKQSKKSELYSVNNNCIHVHCGKDAWEIFYHLYEIYLRKYVLTIIGTQFFYHFVYQLCIQNEKQLLSMLFRGSKVIRVSKMSIYYRIYQKRKISITNLIHMTLNMPESKRCVISFDSKKSLVHSNIVDQNIYTAVGSKIHVSKLVINKFKKQYQRSLLDNKYTEDISLNNVPDPIINLNSKFVCSEFKTKMTVIKNKQLIAYNSVQKRKFEEIEMHENELENNSFSPKYPKISDSSSLKEESYWEQYRSLKPNTIESYSNLLPSNCLFHNLFDNNKSSCKVDTLSNLYYNKFFHSFYSNKSSSAFLVKKCPNSPTIKETRDNYDVKNVNRNSQFDSNFVNAPYIGEYNLMNYCNKISYATNNSSESMPCIQMQHEEGVSLQNFPFFKPTSDVSFSIYIDQGEASAIHADEIFTTASGKSISISNYAMLAAQKFIQCTFQNETHQKIDHCVEDENKQLIKVPVFKKSSVISCVARNYEDDVIISEDINSKRSNKNYELGVNCDSNRVSFSTAAGKTINVSKAAMKAAHKLILGAFENKDTLSSNDNSDKGESTFKDFGCPLKKLVIDDNDNTMDKALVDKLFQDVVFDEKESEDFTEPNKDFNKVSESKKNSDLTTHRIRKSLGGRRSMRFYSNT